MTSLWLADRSDRPLPPNPLVEADRSTDVAVVGAGLTGLITAVLLARAGKHVLVLEAHSAGAGATGNTTAKISLLQGTKLSKIVGKHGTDTARQYVEGNREGQDWLIQHCEAHGLSVQREDAFTYAQSDKGVAPARQELEACKAAGLEADWADEADVPFPFHGGVRLTDQAQFDPMPLLDSLIVELDERGGRLAQGVRVQKVSGEGDELALHVRTTDGNEFDVHAKQCVLATGIPILDRGGFFARLAPSRSYCMAYQVPGNLTHGMYISTDSPTRSVRYAPTPAGDRLIVGGASHPVGHEKSPASSVQELDSWAKVHYPGAMQTHYWSAQDYTPIDELPYVGPILPGHDKIFVATGFDKWGMTNGTAAALALSSPHPGWADGLGGGVRQLEPTRVVGDSQSYAAELGGGAVSGQRLDHPGHADRRPHTRGRRRRQWTAVGPGGPQRRRRCGASSIAGVPAPGRRRELERRRRGMGVPASRVAFRTRRHPARGPGDT